MVTSKLSVVREFFRACSGSLEMTLDVRADTIGVVAGNRHMRAMIVYAPAGVMSTGELKEEI